MEESLLSKANHLAQIIVAVAALLAIGISYYEYLEYKQSQKEAEQDQKVLITLNAAKRWDLTIGLETKPAMEFVEKNRGNVLALHQLNNSSTIQLCQNLSGFPDQKQICINSHKSRQYGYLVTSEGTIPGETANKMRLALIRLLNTLEHFSVLYEKCIGDRKLLVTSYLGGRTQRSYYGRLEPFIKLYGETSWEPYRRLVKTGLNHPCA